MIEIEIRPLKGIEIQGVGSVYFGQTRAEVEAVLKIPPIDIYCSAFCDSYELRIDFNRANATVEFIEFIYGPYSKKTKLKLYGINPFEVEANKLVDFLREKNNGEVTTIDKGYHYFFKHIGISVWRETTEQEALEMVERLKEKGEGKENEDWVKEDIEKSKYFWTVAVCLPNYYSK